MTFSVTGRCARTNMVGVAITTSSICVGARCPWVRAGVGAVSTQNVTDPRLGNEILDYMAGGMNAGAALARAVDNHEKPEHRQIAAIDIKGTSATHSGAKTLGLNAVAQGKNCVAAGNLLSNDGIAAAMVEFFEATSDLPLGERLLASLQAGQTAGGEEGDVHSAALLVAHEQAWPYIDLRVDWSDAPISELEGLLEDYMTQADDYVIRALDPDTAPSYGVPGDP